MSGFTKVPNWVANARDLSSNAKALLIYILSNHGIPDFTFNQTSMMKAMGVSDKTYKKARRELLDKKILYNNDKIKRAVSLSVNSKIWDGKTYSIDGKDPPGERMDPKRFKALLKLVDKNGEFYHEDTNTHYKIVSTNRVISSENYKP